MIRLLEQVEPTTKPSPPMAKEYLLHRSSVATVPTARRIVPPRPGKGQRAPLPYSKDEMDALRATAVRFNPAAMVTLKAPPDTPIATWSRLRATLKQLKSYLTNQHRRRGWPSALAVTEFDPLETTGRIEPVAGFHIGFSEPLDDERQAVFQSWWLKLCNLTSNRGRYFQHDAKGGGPQLANYLAKDVTFRDRQNRPVKFRPAWMPERLDLRLWFCVGLRRQPAHEGRQLRASTGRILRRFESEHPTRGFVQLKASTDETESEHGKPLITTDTPSTERVPNESVAVVAPTPVARSNVDQLRII